MPLTRTLLFAVENGNASMGLARSTGIAAQRTPQRGADFGPSRRTKLGNPFAHSLLRNRDRIVQVHGARRLHAILVVQNHFGGHASDRRSNGRNSSGGQIPDGAVASEHEHGPFFIRRGKLVEPNVASGYFRGHAASASQASVSSRVCGFLE